jgi:ribosomal protein S18 acetylase RimI-like enzyme
MRQDSPAAPDAQLTTNTPHHHRFEIIIGDETHAEFFFEVEVATTWASLPLDRRRFSPEEFCARLRRTHEMMLSPPGHVLFIARDLDSGENLGLLWFGPRYNALTGEEEAWIFNITVLPEHRGCGVAKALMAHAEAYGQQAGFRQIGLSVASHNEPARTLYRQLGYGETSLLLSKSLD